MQSIKALLLILIVYLMSACSDLPYYIQSAQGHWDITQRKQNIDDRLLQYEQSGQTNTDSKPELSPAQTLNIQLRLIRAVRQFTVSQLQLPPTNSFTDYADIERNYVVKNLFAATEFSTDLHNWCYPVIGCASYRGYFDEQQLNEYKAELASQGYDLYVANISAYSTLGWFNDPVLNTFVYLPEYQLVGLLIHEIAHQKIYIDDDTSFNESFASAVEQVGVQQWFEHQKKPDQLQLYQKAQQDKKLIVRLTNMIREDLQRLYQQDISDAEKRRKKQQRLETAKKQYESLKSCHSLSTRFDNWFAEGLNNAKLGSMSTYTVYVDAFIAMLIANNNDFSAFYNHVAALAELHSQQRHECLLAWSRRTTDQYASMAKSCRIPDS